jgi:hypothetical protein
VLAPLGIVDVLSREQAQALTHTIHLLRPAWSEEGIFASLARCKDRDAFEVTLAAIRAAADKTARTPGVIPAPGSHWNELEPTAKPNRRSYNVPCPDHAGESLPCPRCAAARVPADGNDAVQLARAHLAQTRANVCACGTAPSHCADHNPARATVPIEETP